MHTQTEILSQTEMLKCRREVNNSLHLVKRPTQESERKRTSCKPQQELGRQESKSLYVYRA